MNGGGLNELCVYSAAVKRLMQEAKELSHPTELYHAHPVEVSKAFVVSNFGGFCVLK